MGRIKPTKPPSGKIPSPAPLQNPHLTISFKHFNHREPFVFPSHEAKPNYPLTLFERLRDLCGMSPNELRNSRSKSLRSHPIAWEKTSKPEGFDHLNPQIREQVIGWQFTITKSEYGRIHGFWIEDVYYLVWVDHGHALYPKKDY